MPGPAGRAARVVTAYDPAMLAYVFWHVPSPEDRRRGLRDADRGDFHAALQGGRARRGWGRARPSHSARCHGSRARPATRTGTWSRTSRRSACSTKPLSPGRRRRRTTRPRPSCSAGVAGVMGHVAGSPLPGRLGLGGMAEQAGGDGIRAVPRRAGGGARRRRGRVAAPDGARTDERVLRAGGRPSAICPGSPTGPGRCASSWRPERRRPASRVASGRVRRSTRARSRPPDRPARACGRARAR